MSDPWDAFGDDEAAARRLAEWLLVESVHDLEHRSRPDATPYERLGIAGVLRRLLLDRHPVLQRARARLSIPAPEFTFTPMPRPVERHDTLRIAMSFGEIAPTGEATTGDLESFLQAPAAYSFGEFVSVKDVIRTFAHAYGGVHLGAPENRFERIVQRASSGLPLAKHGATSALAGLATVTLTGIRPIAAQIIANPLPEPPMISLG